MIMMVRGQETMLTPAEKEQMAKVEEMGKAIIHKTAEVGGLYRALVTYIRQQSVNPRFAAQKLSDLGFNKVRCSEIIRVAMSPDDVYKDYEAEQISFKTTLDLARVGEGGVAKPTMALQICAQASADEKGLVLDVETQAIQDATKPVAKKKSAARICEHAAAVIFKNSSKGKTWDSGDGWTLTLAKKKSA